MSALIFITAVIVLVGIATLLVYSYFVNRKISQLEEENPRLLPHRHVLLGAYQVIYEQSYDGREPGAYDQCVKCGEWVKREAVPPQHRA